MVTDSRPHMSKIQREVYDFLLQYFKLNDQIPSTRAVQQHFRWGSQNSAVNHMRKLSEKGYLARNACGKYKFVRPFRIASPQ